MEPPETSVTHKFVCKNWTIRGRQVSIKLPSGIIELEFANYIHDVDDRKPIILTVEIPCLV